MQVEKNFIGPEYTHRKIEILTYITTPILIKLSWNIIIGICFFTIFSFMVIQLKSLQGYFSCWLYSPIITNISGIFMSGTSPGVSDLICHRVMMVGKRLIQPHRSALKVRENLLVRVDKLFLTAPVRTRSYHCILFALSNYWTLSF